MQSRRWWRTDITTGADMWAPGASRLAGGALLGLFSLWISAFKSHILIHLDVFSINPAENTDSLKLVEFVSLNP